MKYMLIGPQGIGKTRYARQIADAIGVSCIIDCDHDHSDNRELDITDNSLFVSNVAPQNVELGTVLFKVKTEKDILDVIKILRPVAP